MFSVQTLSLLTQAKYSHSAIQNLTLKWNDTSPQGIYDGEVCITFCQAFNQGPWLTDCHGLVFVPLIFFLP